MPSLGRSTLFVVLLVLIPLREASAGMPSFTLTDIKRSFSLTLSDPTRLRLEAVSFFLLGLLLCAAVIRGVWNSLRKEFLWLPRLSFGKALGVVALWGLLFVLVLTMISGARELMTPGAWEKKGLTYRLTQNGPVPVERRITARYEAIERLRDALFRYADGHERSFPKADSNPEIPQALWRMPDPSGQKYVYVGGRLGDDESPNHLPLVYEAEAVGNDRLVVMTDGWVLWMPWGEIERVLRKEGP